MIPVNKEKKKIADRIRESGFARRIKEDPQMRYMLFAAGVVIAIMIVYAIADGIKQMILL